MEPQEKKGKSGLQIGMALGGIIGIGLVVANKKTRENVFSATKQTVSTVNEATRFVSQNRDEIMQQLKNTSQRFSELMKKASEDLQYISDKALDLKETTVEFKEVTKESAKKSVSSKVKWKKNLSKTK
ncbi:hypothetical protein [Thalassobacillus sp. C254]|uniref:hypothetical protein n=1 Tax=Thalassobacillus sp. C254 TaxID=1225341 RepID=UPI0006D02A78|nr:hypothetical protein [Thalassobacillus sp. C254]